MASLPNSDPKIRVLVADAVAMSCRLLAEALQRNKRYEAAAAVTPQEIFGTLNSSLFDVVLISTAFGDDPADCFRLVREVRDAHPEVNIVVLLDGLEEAFVVEAFRAGARGVFCRSDSFQTLCKCILCVFEGQVWASSAEVLFLLEALAERTSIQDRHLSGGRPLSKREEEIARLVAEGLSNRQISQRLELSEHTIKNYLFRVFDKLGVSTRVELTLYALKQRPARSVEPGAIKSSMKSWPRRRLGS